MRTGISSIHEIAAAHHLPHHQGKCHKLHGHNYRIEFHRYGDLVLNGPSQGMVLDFSDFDAAIKAVLATLDHQLLNDFMDNPTAEILAMYLLDHLPEVDEVLVHETGKHYVMAQRSPNVVMSSMNAGTDFDHLVRAIEHEIGQRISRYQRPPVEMPSSAKRYLPLAPDGSSGTIIQLPSGTTRDNVERSAAGEEDEPDGIDES